MRWIIVLMMALFLTNSLDVFGQKEVRKRKKDRVIESESNIYNLGLNQVELMLNVTDYDSGKEINKGLVEVIFSKKKTDTRMPQASISNGKATLELPLLNHYEIKVSAKDYIDTVFTFDVNEITEYQFTKDIQLKLEMKNYEIQITDIDTDAKNPVRILLTNKRTNEQILIENKNKSGKYSVKIRSEDEYQLEIQNAQRFTFFKGIVNGKDDTKTQVKYIKLQLNSKIELRDITFGSGSNELDENAKKELDRIVVMLMEVKEMKLEIRGHTDSIGYPEYNLQLSQLRAEAVKQYFVGKGIEGNRLEAKGYGQIQPLADNDTEENRAMNRRFELVVTALPK